ncbi:hypothetical protein B0H14DRAFT_2573799 [Mycena olivaceomarginata]|nr:hypothetical protein B0H14DRAFT_2573799 [Mycena olivaceomarginata]
MPRQKTASETRLTDIAAYMNPALTLFKDINNAFGTPFIQPIVNTAASAGALLTAIQNVKRNKDKCFQLTEKIIQVLFAIVNLHLQDEGVALPASTIDHIGKFTE